MYERPFYPPFQIYDGYANDSYGGSYPQGWTNVPSAKSTYSQTPFDYFAKPAQPVNWPAFPKSVNDPAPPPESNVPNGLLTYFQNQDGQVDIDKMLSTVRKFADTFQQITPLFQQFSAFLNNLR